MTYGKKIIIATLSLCAVVFSLSGVASAHVSVKPGEAKTGAYQVFTVGVPSEKDLATVSVKLEVPKDLQSFSPTVKPGWNIEVEKQGSGHDAVATAITWSGGSIPGSYRDEFSFSAKTPAKPTDLKWKATQTYEDGSTVNWSLTEKDQPKKQDGSPDFSKSGPFSVTKVVDNTAQDIAIKQAVDSSNQSQKLADRAWFMGVLGIIVGLTALYFATRKKPEPKK